MLPSEWPGVDAGPLLDDAAFEFTNTLSDDDDGNDNNNNRGRLRKSKDLCKKRRLIVDFADIGWNEWIISPKSFEAHYCAGECPFPMSKVCQGMSMRLTVSQNEAFFLPCSKKNRLSISSRSQSLAKTDFDPHQRENYSEILQ